MKTFFKILLLLVSLIAQSRLAEASHVSGGDITFQCTGPDTYLITLKLFRDCQGINLGTSETVTATSSCGGSASVVVNLVPATGSSTGGQNISQLCQTDSLNSTCFGGSLPGMELYTFTGTIVLSPACDFWTLSWSTCCRNNTVNVPTSNGDDIYIETRIYNQTAPCNNSPVFTAQPIPYVCANQPVSFNFGVFEPDGDSLTFQLISGMEMGGTPLVYGGGYSGAVPIPGITVNPQTGQISFTPTLTGNFIVVLQCNEYNSNGDLISTTMRDVQFVVLACANQVPDPNAGAMTSINGNAVQTGPYSLDICEGNTFSFTAVFTDPNPADTLNITTNMATVLANSTYTTSGTNPLTVTFSWTVPPGAAGTNTSFIVELRDNACPVAGLQTFVYDINVLDRTLAWPDQTICGSQQAQLFASGGNFFTWYDMAGNLIPVGPNFSCNPCANPIASPNVTTSYVVQSNLVGSCISSDTVTVSVATNFNYTITQSQNSACMLQPVQMGVNVNPPGTYFYNWSPAAAMNNSTIPNPTASFNQPGTYTVYLSVSNAQGCTYTDSLQFQISPNVAPVVNAISDTVCVGGTNQLMVDFVNTTPAQCGTTTAQCSGALLSGDVGTSATASAGTTYPSVYGNWYWGSRHQILYTAADLNAMGFTGGKINSIAFNVTSLNGGTSSYNNFEIKMGCTNLTSITNWQSGMNNVYGPVNANVTVGWNTYNLTQLFEWDGISNVIVEVCFNNSSFTNNASNTYTTTAGNTVVYYYQDATGVCSNMMVNGFSNQRPNARFGFCPATPDPSQFTYDWSPGTSLNDSTILNPVTTNSTVLTYSVIVTAIAGGCSDTAQVTIYNLPIPGNPAINIPPTLYSCVNDPPFLLTAADPGGVWNGPAVDPVTGMFDPGNAPLGNIAIAYTITASPDCYVTDTLFLDIVSSPNASIVYTGPDTVCISQAPIQLNSAVPGGTWSGTGIDPLTGIFTPSVAGAGTFDLIYTLGSGNCIEDDTVSITVDFYPDSSLNAQPPLCVTDAPINLVPTTPGGVWTGPGITDPANGTFDPAVATPGQYSVNYTLNGVCSFSSDLGITVYPQPITPVISNNTPLCEGLTINFITGTVQNAIYTWTGPGGYTSNLQNPVIDNITLADSGDYSLVVTVDGCNSLSGTSTAVVLPTPPVPSLSSNSPVCEGQELTLFTDAFPNSIYLWSGPAGFTSNQQNPVIPFATAANGGVYAIAKQANGCSSAQTQVSVIVHPSPNALFSANPTQTTLLDPDVQFQNSSPLEMEYTWDFGDGNSSMLFDPMHTYNDTGWYQVVLTVRDQFTGCFDIDSTWVRIDANYAAFFPKAFTPNGDGKNDDFLFKGSGIENFDLLIFDRWGQQVFRSQSSTATWDGTIRGRPADEGVYIYKLQVKVLDQPEIKKYVGSVHLYR
jgi:gliding motility-associated-like protein